MGGCAVATPPAGSASASPATGRRCSSAAAHTLEDAYGYAKFAREALGTADMDFRARPASAEEADFLRSHVIGRSPTAAGRP